MARERAGLCAQRGRHGGEGSLASAAFTPADRGIRTQRAWYSESKPTYRKPTMKSTRNGMLIQAPV